MKQGWEIKKLGEVGKIFNGNSINERVKSEKYTDIGEGLPYISTKDISYENEIEYQNGVNIPFEEKKNFKIATVNTVLICAEGGSAGRKIAFTNQDVCFGNKLFALVSNENIDSKFVYYYYFSKSFQKSFFNEIVGIIGGVSMNKFKRIQIPIPNLETQQQIVAILEKAFATIDQAKTNAQKNLQNAKELFESSLQIIFTNKGKGWREKSMEEVCEISSKLIDPKLKEFQNLIHIGAGNIESKKGTLVELKTAKEENLISGKFLFDETMVLYSKIRPYLIKVVKCDFKGLCSADIYPLVPLKNIMIKDFLYYLLITKDFTDYTIKGSQRAGMPKVNRNHLFAYKFNLPPLTEQQTIVSKLDALQTETKKLEAIYTQKIADLEELKKSILQKAFAGELSLETAKTETATAKISVSKPKTKVISINPTDLQAGIVSIALQRHQQKNQTHTFHHVKAEKIVHLAQSILCLELERVPCKDAAGPNDFPHSKRVESRAKKAGFYTVHKKADYYEYSEGTQMQKLIDKTYLVLDEKAEKLNNLIDMIVPMTTQQAEIFATVYAGWNNLLLDNKPFTDEDIVTESRENWHKQKLNIEREKFFKAITWMREKNIIPAGIGNKVSVKIPVKK